MPAPSRFNRFRRAHLRLGRRGEQWAAALLLERGFTLLTRNYAGKDGEIDLIVREGAKLCFIEVKTRRCYGRARPGAAVGPAKRERIIKTSHRYLRELGMPSLVYRFDVVEVVLQGRMLRGIHHWPGAFSEEKSSARLELRFPDIPAEYVRLTRPAEAE